MDEQTLRKVVKEVVENSIGPIRGDVRELIGGVKTLKGDVQSLKDDVDSLKVSVVDLEQTVGSYADSYKENQRNIERLNGPCC